MAYLPAHRELAWTAAVILAGIWLITVFVQFPFHRQLARGFDRASARRLVRTNWARTIGWTMRGLLVTFAF